MSNRAWPSSIYYTPLQIAYESADFPSIYAFRRWNSLDVSWEDLVWAALTIGRPNTAHVFRHGKSSFYEAIFRIALVRMAIHQLPFGRGFAKTDAFKSLDPTEKGSVSYFLGMAVCKVFSTALLGTPWLLHLDIFRAQLGATIVGRSRPDLVGQDSAGRWYVFETKGRAGKPNFEDKKRAKDQAQRLTKVDDVACTLHIGCFTYFSQDVLEFYWRDPEPESAESFALSVPAGAWEHYYAAALAIAQADKTRPQFDGIPLDLTVEIHPAVRELLVDGQWDKAHVTGISLSGILAEEGFRPDGLRVACGDSWRTRDDIKG